jgi:ubiquinone biosynthesis protein
MAARSSSSRIRFAERLWHGPAGFRQLLERLGPTYIKIGQFLALRPDLVPQDYCDELMQLFDDVAPFPWETAKAILARELRGDASRAFAYIDPRPVAAGSLAQTHCARLRGGAEVAIKIQRPRIRQIVLRDLRRARLLVRLLEMSGASFIVSPRAALDEVSSWMMQEIDFSRELANLTRLYHLTARDPCQKIPRPYPELSTSRVLTAEYVRGIPFTEVLRMLRSNIPAARRRLLARGINPRRLAANLLYSCLTQIFRYQFFHADLHPGNLMALPGGAIGFVDFGLCDDLDATVRERQLRYLYAVYTDDAELMLRALMEILIPGENADIDGFRREFLEETSAWQRERDFGDRRVHRRSPTAQWMINVMRAARQHGMRVPTRILSMYRALLAAESVANQLGRPGELRAIGRRFFRSVQKEEILNALDPRNLPPVLLSLFNLVRDSPGQLEQILADISEGRFSINAVTTESSRTARARDRRARLIVSAVLSVGLALLLTIPTAPVVGGVSAAWPIGIALALLYVFILVQLRRLG